MNEERDVDVRKLKRKSESKEAVTNKELFDNIISTTRKNMKYFNIPEKRN